ncbi:ATP-binding protein [Nocardia sp. NPDC057030]|uniref:ATP-binding protein n=1 Tax=unclassified Nocardia TaxID=2637762 RepID=UPI003626552E
MSGRKTSRTSSDAVVTSDFVGRKSELEATSSLLSNMVRLVTLLGPGGIGKSRLAIEATARFRKASRVPVYWVGLARLPTGADVAAIEAELAHAIVPSDFSGRTDLAAVVDTLTRVDAVGSALQTVLVLDNCEHVLDAAAEVIEVLLEAIPGLSIVATSREAIGWVDERVVRIPPLAAEDGLALFRGRAELAGYPLTDVDAVKTAGEICQHMHNFPLHIRLAAARLPRQPLSMILRDLDGGETDRRLKWSHRPLLGADERHKGVSDVIQWSYDLCEDKERLLFRRMSVFASGHDTHPDDTVREHSSGADIEAIAAVCLDDPDLSGTSDSDSLVDLDKMQAVLERLVDRSMVLAHFSTESVRYSLMESFRVFAKQQLVSGAGEGVEEYARLAARHRRHFRDKALFARANWFSPRDRELLEWARSSWDDLGRAVESAVADQDAVVGLEITLGMLMLRAPFFVGSMREIRRWVEVTLAATSRPHAVRTESEIAVMGFAVWILVSQGSHEAAQRMLRDAVVSSTFAAELDTDWQAHPSRDFGFPPAVEFAWGCELMLLHRDPTSVHVLGRAREKFTAAGEAGGAAISEMIEAWASSLLSPAAEALEITRRYLDHASAAGAVMAITWAQVARAIALARHGDPVEALVAGRAALQEQIPMHDKLGATWAIHSRIWALARMIVNEAALPQPDTDQLTALAREAAHLDGGAQTQRRTLGFVLGKQSLYADPYDSAIAIARRTLGDDLFDAAIEEGKQLRPEFAEVERLALGSYSFPKRSGDVRTDGDTDALWTYLSTAEQEVAIFAAAGWTNTSIAARRGSSFRTVDAQMTMIFQKLQINSRQEIVEHVPAEQLRRVQAAVDDRPRRRTGGPVSG